MFRFFLMLAKQWKETGFQIDTVDKREDLYNYGHG